MNLWLHKTVLARIAANGGNVPRGAPGLTGAAPRGLATRAWGPLPEDSHG